MNSREEQILDEARKGAFNPMNDARFFENEIERRRYMDAEIACMDYESAMKGSRQEGLQEERQKIQNTAIVKLRKVGVAAKIVALGFSIPLEEVFAIAKRHGVVPAH